MSDFQNVLPPALKVSDFSGGITDNFLGAPINRYQLGENILVRDNKKPITRSGTDFYDLDGGITRIPAGNARVTTQTTHDGVFFLNSGRNVYFKDTTLQTLLGPTGNLGLAAGDDDTNFTSYGAWNGHLMITSDAFGSPMKIYKDKDGVQQVRNAGLPRITLTGAIAQANDVKLQFNLHVNDATEHTGPGGADSGNTVLAPDAFDLPSLIAVVTEIQEKYILHDDDAELVTPDHHAAQESGDHSITIVAAPLTLTETIVALDDLFAQYNDHDADATAHTVGALHQATAVNTPTLSGTADSLTYKYTLFYFYEYTIGGETFRDSGPTVEILIENINAPDVDPITINNIPVITNGTTENFDTVNIKCHIYRTQGDGATSTFVASVDNGTTSFVDSNSDASIVNNIQIYTAGGVLDNDEPPQCKYITVINDITWYAHAKVGSTIFPSRVYQSIKFDPDSVPGDFFIELEDEITGIGGINQYPIVFTKNKAFRLEGFVDKQGRGVIEKREISRTIGCFSDRSIVDARDGLFWAGTDGFYWTDGFRILKVSDEWDVRYASFTNTTNQQTRIFGAYDKQNNRIHWAMQENSGSSDNDSIYVLDLKFGVRPDSCFTSATALNSWEPASLAFDEQGRLVVGDRNGFVFKFNEQIFTDPKKDLSIPEADWIESVIIYDYQSVGFDFGDASIQKYAVWLIVVLENLTAVSISPFSKNEDSGNFQEMRSIRFRDNITWLSNADAPWLEVDGLRWLTFPLIRAKRRFPRRSLRFVYKQVRFSNTTDTIIQISDIEGECVIDTVALTATLTGPGRWETDAVDYFLTLVKDNYETQLLITERNSDTVITFLDPTGFADSGSTKWEMKGLKRGERFNISDYSIIWGPLTPSMSPFRGLTGGNA